MTNEVKSNLEGMERPVAMNNLNAQQKSLLQELSQVFPDLDEVDLFDACQNQQWNLSAVSMYLLDRAGDESAQWKVRESKNSRRKKNKDGEAEKPSGKGRDRKRGFPRNGRRNRNRFDKRNRNRGRKKKDKKKGQESSGQSGVLIPKQKSAATPVTSSSWAARVKQPKPKPPVVSLRPSPNRKSVPESSSSPHRDVSKSSKESNSIATNVEIIPGESEIGAPPGLSHTVWAPVQNDADPILDSPETGGFGVAESEFPFENQSYSSNQTANALPKAQIYNETNQSHPFQEEKKDMQLFTESNPNQLFSNNNSNKNNNNNNNNKNETNSSPFSDHEVTSIASQYSRHMDPIKEQGGYANNNNNNIDEPERNEQRTEYRNNNHEISEFRPLTDSGNEFQPESRGIHFNDPNVLEFDRGVPTHIPVDSRSRPHSRSVSGGLPFSGFNNGVTMPTAPVSFSQNSQSPPTNTETFPTPSQNDQPPPPPPLPPAQTVPRNSTNNVTSNNQFEPHPHHAVTLPDETFHFENSGPIYSFGVDVPEEERGLKTESPPQNHHQMNDMKRGNSSQMPVHMPRNRPLREPMSSRLDIQAPRDIRDPAHHPPPPHRRVEDRVNHHSQIMESSFMENSYNNKTYERKNEIEQDPRVPSRMEPQTEHRIHSNDYNEPNVFSAQKQKEINLKHENRVAPPMYPAEEQQQQHLNNMYTPPQQNIYNQQQPQSYIPHHQQYKHKQHQNPYDMNYDENNGGYVPYGIEEKTHEEQGYNNQYSPTPAENNQYQYPPHSHGLQQTPQQTRQPPPTQQQPSATNPSAAEQHFKPHYTPHHYSTNTASMAAPSPAPLAYSPHTQYIAAPTATTTAVFPYGTHWPHMTSLAASRSSSSYPTVGFTTPSSPQVVYPNHATHHYVRPY